MLERVIKNSTQAQIFIGKLKNLEFLHEEDRDLVDLNTKVVIKQFNLQTESKGFKKELKILKKIKFLSLKKNGGFPLILSAKQSRTLGEILMTYVGNDIFDEFGLASSFED